MLAQSRLRKGYAELGRPVNTSGRDVDQAKISICLEAGQPPIGETPGETRGEDDGSRGWAWLGFCMLHLGIALTHP